MELRLPVEELLLAKRSHRVARTNGRVPPSVLWMFQSLSREYSSLTPSRDK